MAEIATDTSNGSRGPATAPTGPPTGPSSTTTITDPGFGEPGSHQSGTPDPGTSTQSPGNGQSTSTTGTTPPPTDPNFGTANAIINYVLTSIGLDPNALAPAGSVNAGQTVAAWIWQQIVNQGITDTSVISNMVPVLVTQTGQFQQAYPGYNDAVRNGHITSPGQYVQTEEALYNVLRQGGAPLQLLTPQYLGDIIAKGVSASEMAQRVTNGYDQYLTAPAEVRAAFDEMVQLPGWPAGVSAQTAAAQVFLNPDIDPVELFKMLGAAQVRGAGAAANVPISAGLSQRLADMGETYNSAKAKFNQLQQTAGLFQQTVGEQASQTPVAGTTNANQPLTEANQGVGAVFGLSAADIQQVHQADLARENAFKGAGSALTGQGGEALGLGSAKSVD